MAEENVASANLVVRKSNTAAKKKKPVTNFEYHNLDPIQEEEGEEFREDYSFQELEELRQKMGTSCKERRML